MKHFTLLLLFPLFLVACQSKEEKAAEFIKKELSKTLYDFESYSPIETIVTEAKLLPYNDISCREQAISCSSTLEQVSELFNEAKEAKEHMDIWGPPTSYSSSYSDRKYYEYKADYEKKGNEGVEKMDLFKSLVSALKDSVQALDTTKVIGWEVVHRFRCKTRGGNPTIGDYRYVLDKKMKTILIYEDKDEEEYQTIRSFLSAVIEGTFDEEDK